MNGSAAGGLTALR